MTEQIYKKIMKPKDKYIGAFLDGYFAAKKVEEYSFQYFNQIEDAARLAKKKWKQYKKQKLI